jgi:hypothetical protein
VVNARDAELGLRCRADPSGQLGHGAFQDGDAVNAGAALTAYGPVADWSSVALPIGSGIVP